MQVCDLPVCPLGSTQNTWGILQLYQEGREGKQRIVMELLRKSQKSLDDSSTGKMGVVPKAHCASRVNPRKAQGSSDPEASSKQPWKLSNYP